MLNLMVDFTYSVLTWKRSIGANSVKKIKNCHFKLKFGTKPNSSRLNLMLMFNLSILTWKYSFCTFLVQEIKNRQFKLKFATKTNSKMMNSMGCLLFLF